MIEAKSWRFFVNLNCLVVFAIIANVVFASPVSAQQPNAVPVMAICTAGLGACGDSFDATRPQDFKLIQTYLACMTRDAGTANLSAHCSTEAGIRFSNTADYHGSLVSVADGRPIDSKPIPAANTRSAASSGVLPAQGNPVPQSPVASSSAAATPAAVFLIPKGTLIVVRTTQSLNSYDSKTGSKMRFEVAQDAIIGGYVFAKAGDTAEGAVQEGQAGETGFYGFGYKAANLRFSVDNVFNFCGDTVHVDFDRSEYRRSQGLFGSNKDVTVAKGQRYVAVTDRPQKVCAEATNELPEPIPPGAIKTSDH